MNQVYFFNTDKEYIDSLNKGLANFESVIIDNDIDKISLDKSCNLYNDYKRILVAYRNGGLVIDGNFQAVCDLDNLFSNEVFLGYSTENKISTNIIWAKSQNNPFLKSILEEIEKNPNGDITDIISVIAKKDLSNIYNTLVCLNDGVYIYPYDYFYPVDYENCGKDFSENTKLIYYDKYAKISRKKIRKLKIFLKYGPSAYRYIMDLVDLLRFSISSTKYSLMLKLGITKNKQQLKYRIEQAVLKLDEYRNTDYIIIHNPNWLGVTSATKELFNNLLPLEELFDKKDIKRLAKKIVETNTKQVIFSAFVDGWDNLARYIKKYNSTIKLKVFWHGSHSQVIETINWRTNTMVINLHKEGIIDVIGTCKESLVNFYKSQGYKTAFIKNTVNLDDRLLKEISNLKKNVDENVVKIGMYSAGNNWRKNMYNQIAAASLVEHCVIDSVPLTFDSQLFASKINTIVMGEKSSVKREDLLKRLAVNDINLYVTFSECAPMLPIESMEVGTICLTGNNHHYFSGTPLEKFLVVNREDDVFSIYEKIDYALKNKDEIFKLYANWKKDYDKAVGESVTEFLEM